VVSDGDGDDGPKDEEMLEAGRMEISSGLENHYPVSLCGLKWSARGVGDVQEMGCENRPEWEVEYALVVS